MLMMNESLQTSSTGNYQQMTVSLSALRRQKMSTVEVDEVEQQGGTLNVTGNQPWNAVESVPIEGLISQGDLTKARTHLATVTFKVPKAFAVNGKNFCELEILGQADEIFRSASDEIEFAINISKNPTRLFNHKEPSDNILKYIK